MKVSISIFFVLVGSCLIEYSFELKCYTCFSSEDSRCQTSLYMPCQDLETTCLPPSNTCTTIVYKSTDTSNLTVIRGCQVNCFEQLKIGQNSSYLVECCSNDLCNFSINKSLFGLNTSNLNDASTRINYLSADDTSNHATPTTSLTPIIAIGLFIAAICLI